MRLVVMLKPLYLRHNPLKRVKFISINEDYSPEIATGECHNPLKRVKFISMLIRSFMIWHKEILSQSPQTGQVYFNIKKNGK